MEGRLKEDTEIAYQVIDYSPTSWLIVSGNSIEEVLQKEESIVKRISDPLICTSKFIPSIKTQKESKAAVELLLPSAQELYDYYGFDKNSFDKRYHEDILTFKDFISMESSNVKLISNVCEVALGNMTLSKDMRHVILKEGTDTFVVPLEEKIKYDINKYLKKL